MTSGTNGNDTVSIHGNSIYGNSGLGIDLGGNGVTGNDVGDMDGGPNNSQNFPVITAATIAGTNVELIGTFNSVSSNNFNWSFLAIRRLIPLALEKANLLWARLL